MAVLLVEWMARARRRVSLTSARPLVVSVLLAIPVFALYRSLLEHSPAYLAHDEVVYALNAHAIGTRARDVNGRRLPLYFHIGGNFWATPVNIYVTALFVKMFGVSESVIRTPSAVIGTCRDLSHPHQRQDAARADAAAGTRVRTDCRRSPRRGEDQPRAGHAAVCDPDRDVRCASRVW